MTLAAVNKLNRDQALRFVMLQVVVVLVASLFVATFWGLSNAKSLSLGGLTAIVPTLYFALTFFKVTGALAASEITRSFYRAEIGKFILTALIFLFIIKFVAVNTLPFFMGYAVAHSVYWIWSRVSK